MNHILFVFRTISIGLLNCTKSTFFLDQLIVYDTTFLKLVFSTHYFFLIEEPYLNSVQHNLLLISDLVDETFYKIISSKIHLKLTDTDLCKIKKKFLLPF